MAATTQHADGDGFLTGTQVDRRYNISRATRYRWIEAGYLPRPIRFGPGAARWRQSELEAFERRAAEDRGGQP